MPSVVVPSRAPSTRVRPPLGLAGVVIAALVTLAPAAASAQCPASSPFMCPEGSCVRGPGDCASVEGCPSGAPHRCPGGTCAASPAACGTDRALDPTTYWYGPPVDPNAAADQAAADQAADQAAADEAAAEDAAAAEAMSSMPISADLAEGLVCPDATPIGCDDSTCCPEDHPWCCGNGLCGADDRCAVYVGGTPARTRTTFIAPGEETDTNGPTSRGEADASDGTLLSESLEAVVGETAGGPLDEAAVDEDEGDLDQGFVVLGAPVPPRGPGATAVGTPGTTAMSAAASASDADLVLDEESEAATGCDAVTPTAARASTAFGVAALALVLAATLVRMRQNRMGRRRFVTAR